MFTQQMEKVNKDEIKADPDFTGEYGRAWKVPLKVFEEAYPDSPHSTLNYYLIEAYWAHPFWHSYILPLVHLRPVEGLAETKIYLQGATHEFWLAALDPDVPRQMIFDKAILPFLSPNNFAAQRIYESDEAAIADIEKAVQDICNGELNPDTDAFSVWKERFGDTMVKDRWK